MLSGTGVRDGNHGGYLEPEKLGVSHALRLTLTGWLERYENAHFHQFEDKAINKILDIEGIEIAKLLRQELPNLKVTYFSSAELSELSID